MCAVANGIILGFLIYCGMSDWKTKELPVNILVLFSISTGILTLICQEETLGMRIGGAAVGLLFFFISKATREALGYGDSWIVLLLGVYLGAEKLLWLLLIASFLAGLCALFQMGKNKWKREATMPFVPFLAIGYLGVIWL